MLGRFLNNLGNGLRGDDRRGDQISVFRFSAASDEPSCPWIQRVSWLSRTRHCPPTLKAGKSLRRIIRCKVRVETCSNSAASGSVNRRRPSKLSLIRNSFEVLQQCKCHQRGRFNSLFSLADYAKGKRVQYRIGQTMTTWSRAWPEAQVESHKTNEGSGILRNSAIADYWR